MKQFLLPILFLMIVAGSACSKKNESTTQANSNTATSSTSDTNANEADKITDAWIAQMQTALPPAFCGPNEFFRQCFSVTEDECLQQVLLNTKTCLANLKSQIKITNADDGQKWGGEVGGCAGGAYETQMIAQGKRVTDNPKCDDPSAWQ